MFMGPLSFWVYRSWGHISPFSLLVIVGLLIHFSDVSYSLVLQIDAAINSGNSGGPAFNEKGNCVGIAFQSLKHEDAENIGYVIPTPVIKHFIQDYEKNGAYTGMYLIVASTISVDNVLVGFLNSLQFIFVHNFLMIPKW